MLHVYIYIYEYILYTHIYIYRLQIYTLTYTFRYYIYICFQCIHTCVYMYISTHVYTQIYLVSMFAKLVDNNHNSDNTVAKGGWVSKELP